MTKEELGNLVGAEIQHRNGNRYKVILVTNLHTSEDRREEYPIHIVYVGENGKVWDRTIEKFKKSMTILKK